MGRNELLPPAVRDIIDSLQNPRRSTLATDDNLLARLEAISEATRLAAEAYKRQRRRILEGTSPRFTVHTK